MHRLVPLCALAATLAAADPVGFRNDGCGRFPATRPPTSWDLATGTNIRWQVAMPTPSNAAPLVVDGRVITVASPELVLCHDADGGEERWPGGAPAAEAVPPTEREEAIAAFAEGWQVLQEYQATPRKQRGGDLKKTYDRSWSGKGVLGKRWGMTGPNDFGWAMPSPVWDGERVIVRFETGSVAAFDLDGKRLWLTRVPQAGGHETPVVAGGVVVFTRRDGKADFDLVGLDAATGRQRWTSSEQCRNPHDTFAGGGPALARIGDRVLVVSHGGELVDPADGTVLAHCAVQGHARASTPVVIDDVVVFPAQPDHGKGVSGLEAFRLQARDTTVTATPLWQSEPTGMETMTSPLWTGEHLVLVYRKSPFLWTYDPRSGGLLNGDVKARASIVMGGHHPSPSPALAGGLLWGFDERGGVVIARPGPQPVIVGTQQLEPMGATPAFVGDRIYARTHQHLICIGK